MIARWIAAALVAVGLVLYAAVAVPMRRQAAAAADDYRRARDEARDMRARLARLERRDAAHLRAASALAGATPGGHRARRCGVPWCRRCRARASPASGWASRPARSPYAARVRLSAIGSFPEVMALAGRVARPETGVVLERIRLTPRGDGVALDLDGVTLGPGQ